MNKKSKFINALKILKNIIVVLINILVALLITLKVTNGSIDIENIKNINISLFILILSFTSIIFSFLIFKPKKIGNFIYKFRYLLSIFILIVLVLGKFNGSSIGMWNKVIEPNNNINNTLIGTNREIRSDEWLVNTPYAISQQYNDYKYFNDLPRGSKTDMFSTIFVPIKDILIVSRPFNIGYLLFGEEYGLSFYWFGRFILLLLVTFEFMMLLTNKKKLLSLGGAVLIAGSPLIQWYYSNYIIDLLISGQLCLLMFNNYLSTKKIPLRILYSILIGWSFSWFALTLYPAWQIPLGYMYLAFAIWIFVKNFKNNKHINNYLLLTISITIIALLIYRYLSLGLDTMNIIMSTVYPGARNSFGGGDNVDIIHFIYPISMFFGIADYKNPCESATTYSLFPIPIIISIIYLLINGIKRISKKGKVKKDENHTTLLLILLTIISIYLTIFTLTEIPAVLAKLTLINMCIPKRIVQIVGIICSYMLIILVGKINIKNIWLRLSTLILIVPTSYLILKIGSLEKPWYLTDIKYYTALILLVLVTYFFINSCKKWNEYILSLLLIFVGAINIIYVNPINIGTKVLHEKDTAKEIQRIVKEDKNAKWISIDEFLLGNYVISNGGKAINSTNIYPNLELWKKIDPDKKFEDIYNRYAHVVFEITEEKSSFKLVQMDMIMINLNYDDLKTLDIKYMISNKEIYFIDSYQDKIKNIYHKDNIWIYKYSE